jgi:hypothetical protein
MGTLVQNYSQINFLKYTEFRKNLLLVQIVKYHNN